MSEYGYLNHTSTEKRDGEAIEAMFALLPCESVAVEQLWSPGQKRRPALEALLERLQPGDTLYVHGLDRLGAEASEIVKLWKTVTEQKGANIALLDDLALDSRKNPPPTLPQVREAAKKSLEAARRALEASARPFATFELQKAILPEAVAADTCVTRS